ncbi:hypothetical protein CROQUDRAFT_651948 [Cronartium quercuum f. sp. fusiforme G11]|uniref:Uncharacterized protein n=1 Tax=Cronartium quercuum f. sp. fusiforme G11 TaxID=708437 RepID=A0A9P6NWI4_9BASI|nr:hypothetical protein CROQUDRAFT_651948 [Cronartium quercuum f. sp. fusiforme G11]
MRLTSVLRAGGRATAKAQKPSKPRVRALKPKAESAATSVPEQSSALPLLGFVDLEAEESDRANDFSGRVHSESYSAQNLSAAFDSILSSKVPPLSTPNTSRPEMHESSPQSTFLAAIQHSTLSTMDAYRTSILNSLALDDPHGRIYSKNVRQMKEILGFEKWRKKLELDGPQKGKKTKAERHPITRALLPPGSLAVRKALFDRPSVADEALATSMVKDLWKLDQLVDATVVVAYSGKRLVNP